MAKMFYSLEEAAQRLGRSTGDVQGMVSSGQLQEFRGGDNKLMFKREQVDLLAGESSKGDSGMRLADSKGNSGIGLSLEDSAGGSGAIELDDPAPVPSGRGGGAPSTGSGRGANERSGISIFDTESTEEGDPSAVTRITETAGAGELTLDSVGSGSGLLDLTRESDDTSLGADLLEDVYKPEDAGTSDTQGASGLFESTAAPSDVGGAAPGFTGGMGMIAAEPYDPAGSGWGGGLALATLLVMAATLAVCVMGLLETDNPLASLMGGSLMMWVGIFGAAMLIFTVIGLVLGKRAA